MAMSPNALTREPNQANSPTEVTYEKWHRWPVDWSAIWVGTLATVAITGLFGLIATAVGANLFAPEPRVVDLKAVRIEVLAFGICSAFFAFVAGGWIAGKIAGILHSEPAMLHGAIVWLLATPALLVLVAIGARGYAGGWYGGLAATATWIPATITPPANLPPLPTAGGADYQKSIDRWNEESAAATRNAALFAITALLLGLMGSAIGGWMASGEPMTLTHHRHRVNSTARY